MMHFIMAVVLLFCPVRVLWAAAERACGRRLALAPRRHADEPRDRGRAEGRRQDRLGRRHPRERLRPCGRPDPGSSGPDDRDRVRARRRRRSRRPRHSRTTTPRASRSASSASERTTPTCTRACSPPAQDAVTTFRVLTWESIKALGSFFSPSGLSHYVDTLLGRPPSSADSSGSGSGSSEPSRVIVRCRRSAPCASPPRPPRQACPSCFGSSSPSTSSWASST